MALDEISEVISDGESVEAELEAKELMNSVNSFLRALPTRDCDVFVCRYFYFNSIDEIAEKYELSAKNVFKILSRTRIKLREYLIKEGYFV